MSRFDKILGTFQGDRSIWIIILLLSLCSMMAVYSSTSLLAYQKHTSITVHMIKHTGLIVLAFAFMWFMHNISYQYYSKLYRILLPLSIAALIYAMFFGERINDASRWIKIPIINQTFQASDLAKLALMLYLARHISVHQDHLNDFKKGFLPMLIWTMVIVFLVFLENISTGIMILFTAFVVMFLGRVRILHFIAVSSVGLMLAALGYVYIMYAPDQFLFKRLSTAKSRLASFTESKKDFKEVSYQVQQANIAIARGGIIPRGPGNSSQKNFLPNAFSDYVYAIIIEEWGIIGGLFVVFLYLALLFRVIIIVMKSPQTFGAILALGLGISVVIQAFFHMLVNVGIFPTTGVTLPLVSMGGSSIVFIAMALGIILSVSRSIQNGELGESPKKENYFDDLEIQLSSYKNDHSN